MGQLERLLAALSVLLVFVYVALRALYVPTFHDEAATFFHYIVPGKFLPYQAHWDANNHILNSTLAYFCYKVFGDGQFWIRLPNVLSFLIYGFFAFRISSELKSGLLRWMTLTAILTAVFPLEFFSLARGYAMSLAFLLGAIFYGARYLRTGQLKEQLLLWFWMWLAVAASLTLINTYIILLGLVFLTLFTVESKRSLHVLVWAVFGLMFFAAAAFYGFELKERGLLYTGLDDGFVEVTVRSLVRYQLQKESALLSMLVTAIGALAALLVLLWAVLKSLEWSAVRLTAALLLLNAVGSILLNLIFGMNFPENRVGMYYIPLFLITVAGALDQLAREHRHVKWLGLSFLFFPLHLAFHFNFNTTILWPKWHGSERVYAKAVELQRTSQEPLMISAEYLNELGWAYYNFQNGAEMQLLQRIPIPDTLADLIIARPNDFDFSAIDPDTLYNDAAIGVYLLQRKQPVRWSAPQVLPLKLNVINGSDEFYELLNDSVNRLPGNTGCFKLSSELTAKDGFFDGQLVITSADSEGNGTYDYVPMHWLRQEWHADPLLLKRTYHFAPDAVTFKMYVWNMNRQEIQMRIDELHFRVPE